ncbi:hypothetical protein GOP47_0008633 [Adiantum capillus-veneris]|uniref:RRM domain-containing protein n=1 Tax=Adiantum capillus-veneris TaxID=13818 RepID=A0A9D4ZI84_ADICA|nr:hypothetical protein GOP47_0008633 [Adiantum capillus-veneris]
MSSTQHRCVFVGNIPYDATEEELIRICEEVGPVVSFRLVIDRDTGKPKGYGFCEYRDEETALSARRNLQGYDINGRQLRVDFAENEKGSADRNRDQGRGGPGFVDLSKQSGGLKGSRDVSLYQPVGLPAAVSAAAVMASLLGAPQSSAGNIAQLGVARPPPGIDALTVHLAGMSKYQLYDVLNHMKNFIQQNQQQARQVLTSNTQLVKALFQAQIILGWVPQVPLQNLQPQGLQQAATMPVQQGHAHQAANNSQLQQGLQHAQAQRAHNYPFPLPTPTQQQMSNRTGLTMISQQPLPPAPSGLGLPPLNLNMQRSQPQPPLHLNPPPLPQQIRPMLPPSPPQGAQVSGLQPSLGQVANLPQIQQPNGLSANMSFMGVPPPLPSQPPPHMLQVPRPMGDMGGNSSIGQGGLPSSGGLLLPTSGGISQFARGAGTDLPSTSAPFANWNQLPASSGIVGAPLATTTPAISMPMSMPMGLQTTKDYSQSVMQPPIQQPPTQQLHNQQLPSQQLASQQLPNQQPPSQHLSSQQPLTQQQPQVSLEPEQQKVLLQQVMNLTPEQINSLPPEQRQQVLDLQQAFRNQIL